MLCLEHLFATSPQTVCMAPWNWWDRLAEGDQAQWAGAGGSVTAVVVAVSIYLRDRSAKRREEQDRLAVSQRYQAIRLESVMEDTGRRLGLLEDRLLRISRHADENEEVPTG